MISRPSSRWALAVVAVAAVEVAARHEELLAASAGPPTGIARTSRTGR